LIVEE